MAELEPHTKKEKQMSSNETFQSLAKDFCGYTSAHGLERVMSAKQWIRKAFWSLLFVAAITVLALQVRTLYMKYQQRPLVTLVTLQSDTSLTFPVVTLCNFNALKYDALLDSNLTALIQTFQRQNYSSDESSADLNEDEAGQRRKRRSTENDFLNPAADQLNGEDYDYDDYEDHEYFEGDEYDEYGEHLDYEYIASEKVALLMAEEDKRYLSTLGHQFEDMVLSCTFRGIPCSNFTDKFWSKYWHYKYGNCYVFNSGTTASGKRRPTYKSNKAGPSHGLTVELYIEQDQYLDSFSPEAGIRLDITTQGQMPFPMERGLSLPPGFVSAVGLRKVIIERQDPFNNDRCHADTSRIDENLYTKMYNVSYSATACKESCLARNQFKNCGCMEYKFPVDWEPICNITNKNITDCLNKVQKLFRENKLNCSSACSPPCRQEEFKITSSFAAWPADNYENFFQTELEKRGKYAWSENGTSRKNVLKVQVFYEELNVEVVKEKRSYELPDFASDIGGQLGLWIGFSVLTIAEFLEFAMLLICLAVRKCSSSTKVDTATVELNERESKKKRDK